MKFRFPIIIIDEDWRSDSASGLGIRALAKAIEDQGTEVVGGFTYFDVSMVANQAARASSFIVSIDDEEITEEGPESQAIQELRKFILETRRRNADIPIFLFGETRTSQHIPNEILKELHGFIHMFEDTPEFVARYIIREATNYLNSLAPPFFKALVHYANDGSYSWHCPGHSGGVAFLKSPVGQMFHQFFGENMLRADVCNAVDELGQLLDHTGPVAKSEHNAARIFNCDHLYFVTNGTSTSNKIVWHSGVARDDIVLVDRNCHKSVLHAIMMTGTVPIFLQPTRNHLGIIGPDPAGGVQPGEHPRQDRGQPAGQGQERQAAGADDHPVHLRRHPLQRGDHQGRAWSDYVEILHFDEAWLPHATFHPLYHEMHAIGVNRPRSKNAMVFATQSTHKLLAGLSQASQILVQESETRKLDRYRFNEAYLMHTSTSPQYAIIASCDVAAAMMEPPGGTALVRESIVEALDFRNAMRKVGAEYGDSWWFPVWGPENFERNGSGGRREDWMLKSSDKWHGFGKLHNRLQHARPDQGDDHHAGTGHRRQLRGRRHSGGGRHQVPGRARRGGREDQPLFVLHHVHHRHHQGPLEYAGDRAAAVQVRLRREPAAVAGDAGVRRRQSAATSASACATCRRRSTRPTRATTWRASPPRCTCRKCSRR